MNVSRETAERLIRYGQLLTKWNRRLNLVSPDTIASLDTRHIADSEQLLRHAEADGRWIDLGSGGGLPAVVIAILRRNGRDMILIESDRRKCEFLRTARRELALEYEILPERIETASPGNAAIVSARALAPLPRLLELAVRHGTEGTQYLFPKGQSWRSEIEAARKDWHFDVQTAPSETDPSAAILSIRNVRPQA